MSKAFPNTGRTYGLKTKKGIALLQIVEPPLYADSSQLTRICDGFLPAQYTNDDIRRILRRKEQFFLDMPLHLIDRNSELYNKYFAFDAEFDVPHGVKLPIYQRGQTVLRDGTVVWYKRRRGSNYHMYVTHPNYQFWRLSPDGCWSLPELCDFLENEKRLADHQ